jgi:hypothetical protein
MTPTEYRAKAAELLARAQREGSRALRLEYKILAQSYFGLANLAERNSRTDIVYETPRAASAREDGEGAADQPS